MTWLYVPSLSTDSRYAPGWEDWNSESSSPCPATELCVTSSGKPMLRPYSWRGWKTRPWIKRLFGTISNPSMAERGVESWISSLRASRASPTPSPASRKDMPTTEPCGPSSSESWASVDPPWSSSRTSQLSLGGFESPESDYVSWVTRSKSRSSSLRRTLAHRISASACSSWPTPQVRGQGGRAEWAAEGKGGRDLTSEAMQWQTPAAAEGFKYRRQARQTERGEMLLPAQVVNWPTPRAFDATDIQRSPEALERAKESGGCANLGEHAKVWPSPRAEERQQTNSADDYVALSQASRSSHPVLQTSTCGPECSPKHRRLNPRFVSWLMNLPIGWSSFEPLEMRWSHWWRQSRSWLSRLGYGE